MTDDPEDLEKDDALSHALQAAPPPAVPARLDERVAASYLLAIRPAWPLRLWRARVNITAPVAAIALVLLFAAGAFARDVPWSRLRFGGSARGGLANLKPLPEIQLRITTGSGQ